MRARCVIGTFVAMALLAAPRAVHAQSTDDRPLKWEGWQRSHCMAGLTYGAPMKLAVSYGTGYRRQFDGGANACAMAIAKIGIGGVQGGVGFGRTVGALGGGAMLSANVLRTFASPLHASARRTYVGASVHYWPIIALGGEIGVYTRLGDASGANSALQHIVSWSFGVGF